MICWNPSSRVSLLSIMFLSRIRFSKNHGNSILSWQSSEEEVSELMSVSRCFKMFLHDWGKCCCLKPHSLASFGSSICCAALVDRNVVEIK